MANRSMLPSVVVDEILAQKSEPRIAARRSRFRRVVFGAVGTCGAICALALVVSAVQALGEPEARAATTRIAVDVPTAAPPTRTALPEASEAVAKGAVGEVAKGEAKAAAWDGSWATSFGSAAPGTTATAGKPSKAAKAKAAPRKAHGKRH